MDWRIFLEEMLAPAFFAGLTITLLSYLFAFSAQNAILFASLGSSAFVLAGFPDLRGAKLRVVFLSYAFGGLFGYACSFIGIPPIAGGMAVFLTSIAMLFTKNEHAPSAGLALAFAMQHKTAFELVYVLILALLMLFIIKAIVYLYKKELNIKKFHHEFME